MEDKWFIFLEDNNLFFYRSWTGNHAYTLALNPIDHGVGLGSGTKGALSCVEGEETTGTESLLGCSVGKPIAVSGISRGISAVAGFFSALAGIRA
jgi:hypothetical protein